MTPAKEIMEILIRCKVVPPDYVGQVVLHIGQGGLCDVERREKGLKRLLENQIQEGKSNGQVGR